MFVEQPDDSQLTEEEKRQQANTPTVGTGGGGEQTVGGTSMPATGNFSTTSPVQGQQPVQQWATAQDYLKANQPQAENLGQKVQENLTGTLESAKGAIDTGASQAKSAIEVGTTPYNEALVSEAAKTPTAITGNEQKLSDFLKQWNASYAGPESFEASNYYTPAATAAQKGTEQSELLKSTGGREQLLGEQFNIYGAGNKGLDQAILQQAPQYEQIQTLAPQFGGLQNYLSQKATEVNPLVEQAKQTAQGTKEATQAALKTGTEQFKTQLANETAAAQQKAQASIDAIKNALAKNASLTDEQLGQMGLTREQFTQLQAKANELAAMQARYPNPKTAGTVHSMVAPSGSLNDLQKYLTAQTPESLYSQANVATPEEYQKAAALAQLTGTTSILNPNEAAQAGQTSPLFSTDYKAALGSYDQQIKEIEGKLSADEQARLQAIRQAEADRLAAEKEAEKKNLALGLGATVAPMITGPIAAGSSLINYLKQNPVVGAIANPVAAGVGAVAKPLAGAAKKAASRVGKSLKKAFCFAPATQIQLTPMSTKAIKDLSLGEATLGGDVLSIRKSLTSEGTRYDYNGISVTGSHAVKENGKWIRVENSSIAQPIDGPGLVYSIVTTNHRIFINGIEFADEIETDNYEDLTIDESLQYLNTYEFINI